MTGAVNGEMNNQLDANYSVGFFVDGIFMPPHIGLYKTKTEGFPRKVIKTVSVAQARRWLKKPTLFTRWINKNVETIKNEIEKLKRNDD